MRICIEIFACALGFIGALMIKGRIVPTCKKPFWQFINKCHYRTAKTVALTVFLSNAV